jgi:hypothetical protein
MNTPVQQATVPAPPGTKPNNLVKSYPAGSVVAPSSIPAAQTGHKNVGQDMRQYQVPQ